MQIKSLFGSEKSGRYSQSVFTSGFWLLSAPQFEARSFPDFSVPPCVSACVAAQVASLMTKTQLTVVLLMVPVANAVILASMGPSHCTLMLLKPSDPRPCAHTLFSFPYHTRSTTMLTHANVRLVSPFK